MSTLPNDGVLLNLLSTMEAQASSEIENIVTTTDELFRAHTSLPQAKMDPAVKEALRYKAALLVGLSDLERRPLSTRTVTRVCSTLLDHDVDVRSDTGTFIGNPTTKKRIYTPPQGKEVITRHLDSLFTFISGLARSDADSPFVPHDLHPLLVMALAHYQFEAIHPFSDGNGRTGRILNLLILCQEEMLTVPTLYLSGFILRNKSEYYRRLRAVTEKNEWEPWVLFILKGIREVAEWTNKFVVEVADAQREMEQKIAAADSRIHAAEVARILFSYPYSTVKDFSTLAARQTASRWLGVLVEKGLIQKEVKGKTHIFINRTLLDLVDDYSEQLF